MAPVDHRTMPLMDLGAACQNMDKVRLLGKTSGIFTWLDVQGMLAM